MCSVSVGTAGRAVIVPVSTSSSRAWPLAHAFKGARDHKSALAYWKEENVLHVLSAALSVFLAPVRVSVFACSLAICISPGIDLFVLLVRFYNVVFVLFLLINRNSVHLGNESCCSLYFLLTLCWAV